MCIPLTSVLQHWKKTVGILVTKVKRVLPQEVLVLVMESLVYTKHSRCVLRQVIIRKAYMKMESLLAQRIKMPCLFVTDLYPASRYGKR